MIIELEKTCDLCGQKFRNKRIDAIFCSSACRQKANRLKKMQENTENQIDLAKKSIEEDAKTKNKDVQKALQANRELADFELQLKKDRDDLQSKYEEEKENREFKERLKREKKEAKHKAACSSIISKEKINSEISFLKETIDNLRLRDEKYKKLSAELKKMFKGNMPSVIFTLLDY